MGQVSFDNGLETQLLLSNDIDKIGISLRWFNGLLVLKPKSCDKGTHRNPATLNQYQNGSMALFQAKCIISGFLDLNDIPIEKVMAQYS